MLLHPKAKTTSREESNSIESSASQYGGVGSRELVCHIDYQLLMRAKIARNASSNIDGIDLHPEKVFL